LKELEESLLFDVTVNQEIAGPKRTKVTVSLFLNFEVAREDEEISSIEREKYVNIGCIITLSGKRKVPRITNGNFSCLVK
jgi:hypothetical protein